MCIASILTFINITNDFSLDSRSFALAFLQVIRYKVEICLEIFCLDVPGTTLAGIYAREVKIEEKSLALLFDDDSPRGDRRRPHYTKKRSKE